MRPRTRRPAFPRQREVYRAQLAPGTESLAVVVSCDEANALRGVVTVCELRADPGGLAGLPTVTALPAAETGLGAELVAVASPYTVPKGCLVGREGALPPLLYEELAAALRRVFGWERWPL